MATNVCYFIKTKNLTFREDFITVFNMVNNGFTKTPKKIYQDNCNTFVIDHYLCVL